MKCKRVTGTWIFNTVHYGMRISHFKLTHTLILWRCLHGIQGGNQNFFRLLPWAPQHGSLCTSEWYIWWHRLNKKIHHQFYMWLNSLGHLKSPSLNTWSSYLISFYCSLNYYSSKFTCAPDASRTENIKHMDCKVVLDGDWSAQDFIRTIYKGQKLRRLVIWHVKDEGSN